jgi:predicted enzyme related to lactoylglutathione lyase
VPDAFIGLVLDASDPEALAPFWAEALRMNRQGAAGSFVLLTSEDGPVRQLLLQRVAEPKAGKNRMHLDIEIADVDGEVRRLEALGARRLEPDDRTEHGSRWVVMADPEGNEFCVCDSGQGSTA